MPSRLAAMLATLPIRTLVRRVQPLARLSEPLQSPSGSMITTAPAASRVEPLSSTGTPVTLDRLHLATPQAATTAMLAATPVHLHPAMVDPARYWGSHRPPTYSASVDPAGWSAGLWLSVATALATVLGLAAWWCSTARRQVRMDRVEWLELEDLGSDASEDDTWDAERCTRAFSVPVTTDDKEEFVSEQETLIPSYGRVKRQSGRICQNLRRISHAVTVENGDGNIEDDSYALLHPPGHVDGETADEQLHTLCPVAQLDTEISFNDDTNLATVHSVTTEEVLTDETDNLLTHVTPFAVERHDSGEPPSIGRFDWEDIGLDDNGGQKSVEF